ncbi:TetR/AcrR family transcriptional regulator [Hydrocarboniphaga effusa]|uniref:TetR/AcrR family transcriptional regulator n=1 Tax=Hydrocarboniphaga effusa TaxID=243629 RepID=UPI002AB8B293|nr:helix-turn-helix domain-containing protein [Hydrocarboniphaga sp.]
MQTDRGPLDIGWHRRLVTGWIEEGQAEGARWCRRRDPEGTRTAMLEAAGALLAKEGAEGLSVSQIAPLARVNRGTAYRHFQARVARSKHELVR